MRLTISRSIHDYWESLREDGQIPLRSRVQPGPISPLLPDLFILHWTDASEPTFRLAGTRVCTILGLELGGLPFAAIWDEREADILPGLVHSIAVTGQPACLEIHGERSDYPPLSFEMMLLPVIDTDRNSFRIIGSLAPDFTSAWQLVEPVDVLHLDSIHSVEAPEIVHEDGPDTLPQPGLSGLWRRLTGKRDTPGLTGLQ